MQNVTIQQLLLSLCNNLLLRDTFQHVLSYSVEYNSFVLNWQLVVYFVLFLKFLLSTSSNHWFTSAGDINKAIEEEAILY